MLLLPTRAEPQNEEGATQWKIWIISTRLESLDVQQEDENLLRLPARQFNDGSGEVLRRMFLSSEVEMRRFEAETL